MEEIESMKSEVSMKSEQPNEKWMAPGVGAGAALWILFGNFVLGPAMDSQTTGYVLGVSMGAAIGLVSGLLLSSGSSHKTVNGEEKENWLKS